MNDSAALAVTFAGASRRRCAQCAALLAALVALGVAPLAAQIPIQGPEASPHAFVGQTIGVTDVVVDYHRPAVAGREIWGALVPWDEVWRAGANENTTITVSTDVTVEGKALAAGTYGLHMIPGRESCTVAFSRMAAAWGSFSYDEAEDALRVVVEPRPAPFRERLAYSFDAVTDRSAELVLHWAELVVPLRLEVDLGATVVASVEEQLRGLPRFSWQGWNQAAAATLAADGDLDRAAAWVDRSISMNRNFTNLETKARVLERRGDAEAAAELRASAMETATEVELNAYGYRLLLGERKVDEAIAVFAENVRRHPDSWNVYDSLAEAQAVKGLTGEAIANYEKARAMTEDETQQQRIDRLLVGLRAE